MNINFPKFYAWQLPLFNDCISVINNPNNEVFVVCSPRQCGKNHTTQSILVYYSLAKVCTSIMIEPTFAQCRKVYRQLVKMFTRNNLILSASGSTFDIILKNGSEINLRSAAQKESLRGLTVNGILILDECSYISTEVYEIVRPFCNVHKAPMILCSTPVAKSGFFWDEYNNKDNKIYYWNRNDYDMTNILSNEQFNRYQKTMTPQKFKTEILGEFLDSESVVFGDFSKCIYTGMLQNNVPIYAGIDFSTGNGNDSTVVTFLNSDKEVCYIWETNKMTPQEQINHIAELLNNYPTLKEVRAEKNSIGSVYFSSIQDKLKNKYVLKEFTTTNDSKREIIENLILAFQNEDIHIPDDKTLINQLSYYTLTFSNTGKPIYNNANDDIHDDYVMSLAIAYSCFRTNSNVGSFGFAKK